MSDKPPLVDASVVTVREMTKEELDSERWAERPGKNPTAIEFDDGTVLYAAQDPEGNGPGALFGDRDGEKFGFP